jgi:Domain of unknown function (DUF1990)
VARPSPSRRALVSLRWPLGVLLTSFAYLWRTTPMHRRELEGSWEVDRPPEVEGSDTELDDVQWPSEGAGAYLRRRYRVRIAAPRATAAQAMREIQADPGIVAPGQLASFLKSAGEEGTMRVGDEFLIKMPGPWDGPVRVVERTPTSFRFVTLEGHIEAGQIEWRARDEDGRLIFEVESWSRPGDRLSHLMHHRLRMAKEVQLHMWTSVLERVMRRYGRRDGPLDIETRVVEVPCHAHDNAVEATRGVG